MTKLNLAPFVILQVGRLYIDNRDFIVFIDSSSEDGKILTSHTGQTYYKDGQSADPKTKGMQLIKQVVN